MKTFSTSHISYRLLTVAVAVGAMAAVSVPAQESKGPSRLEYSSFKIITDRNIFNPNRSGSRPSTYGENSRPARVESFTLVGTLSYEKGDFAFFDGSVSDFRKVLQRDGTIAGFKLTYVDTKSVKLSAGTNEYALQLGMQMRREDEGPWRPTVGGELYAQANAGPSGDRRDFDRGERGSSDRRSDYERREREDRYRRGENGRFSRDGAENRSVSASAPSSAPSSGPSADPNEVLKRLMQQREKE